MAVRPTLKNRRVAAAAAARATRSPADPAHCRSRTKGTNPPSQAPVASRWTASTPMAAQGHHRADAACPAAPTAARLPPANTRATASRRSGPRPAEGRQARTTMTPPRSARRINQIRPYRVWVSTAPRIGGARLAIQPFSVTTVACRPRSSRLVAATARPLQRAPWSHCRARGSTEAPPAASAARHAGAPTTPAKARIPNSPMPLPR